MTFSAAPLSAGMIYRAGKIVGQVKYLGQIDASYDWLLHPGYSSDWLSASGHDVVKSIYRHSTFTDRKMSWRPGLGWITYCVTEFCFI